MNEPRGVCPCCGNDLNIERGIEFHLESHTLVSSDFAVIFTAHESIVFGLLWRGRNTGRVTTKQNIFDHIYALDPDGGPDPKVIDVLLTRIRKRLSDTSLEVVNIHNSGWILRGKNERAAPRVNRRAIDTLREAAE